MQTLNTMCLKEGELDFFTARKRVSFRRHPEGSGRERDASTIHSPTPGKNERREGGFGFEASDLVDWKRGFLFWRRRGCGVSEPTFFVFEENP